MNDNRLPLVALLAGGVYLLLHSEGTTVLVIGATMCAAATLMIVATSKVS